MREWGHTSGRWYRCGPLMSEKFAEGPRPRWANRKPAPEVSVKTHKEAACRGCFGISWTAVPWGATKTYCRVRVIRCPYGCWMLYAPGRKAWNQEEKPLLPAVPPRVLYSQSSIVCRWQRRNLCLVQLQDHRARAKRARDNDLSITGLHGLLLSKNSKQIANFKYNVTLEKQITKDGILWFYFISSWKTMVVDIWSMARTLIATMSLSQLQEGRKLLWSIRDTQWFQVGAAAPDIPSSWSGRWAQDVYFIEIC